MMHPAEGISIYQGAPMRKFVSPEIVFGAGALRLVGRYVRNLSGCKVLIVSDKGVRGAGWVAKVEESLGSAGVDHVCFDRVSVNPRIDDVMSGVDAYSNGSCDLIVAVGGGSPIDCAKVIGVVTTNRCTPLELEGVDKVPIPGPPMICIPTTAGSSADVSQFAIVNDDGQRKFSIISKSLVPDVSLIDPSTTATLPRGLTASTGMDALSHAFEAYVSNASSPITDMHALEATRIISENLPRAYEDPTNMRYRDQMMLASLFAGLAFSNASLGLIHAMSHSLGGYLDIGHGECNALLMDEVIGFNYPAVPERYRALEMAFSGRGGQAGPASLVKEVREFRIGLGLDVRLSDLGVRCEDIPHLSATAWNDPSLATNPRAATLQDIERLYERAL